MADKWPLATGVWSNAANWNGGTLPAVNDDVFADGKTVTIDQSVTVLSIRTSQRSGGTLGGSFVVSGGHTITATGAGVVASGSACLTASHTSGTTLTINGRISAGGTQQYGLSITSSGTTNITGNIIGGQSGGNTSHGINMVGASHTLNVTGSVTGTGTGFGIAISATCSFNITGQITSIGVNQGINITASSNGTVTGTLSTSSGTTACTISTTGTYSFIGAIQATGSTALNVTGAATVTMTGPFISSATGGIPFSGPTAFWLLSPIANNEYRFRHETSGTSSLYSTDVTSGSPSASDVRSGTTYGIGSTYTGTCAVPAAASVAYGVPVDNTTGTKIVSASETARLVGLQIAAVFST
jgi:hypothetical protein